MALDGKILVCIFNTLDLMVREERKSRNFLHAVELQLQILFSPLFLHLFQKHQIEEGDEAKANGDESMSELTSLIKAYILYLFSKLLSKSYGKMCIMVLVY